MAFFHESIPPGLLNRLKGLAEWFVFAEIFKLLKGQCHEIFHNFFMLKRFDLGPKWEHFCAFFNFLKIFNCKVRKLHVSILNYCYIGCVNTPKYLVHVVNDYFSTWQNIFLRIFANIFAKTNNFLKQFLSVCIGAQVKYFKPKKDQKSCDTVPLSSDNSAPCQF